MTNPPFGPDILRTEATPKGRRYARSLEVFQKFRIALVSEQANRDRRLVQHKDLSRIKLSMQFTGLSVDIQRFCQEVLFQAVPALNGEQFLTAAEGQNCVRIFLQNVRNGSAAADLISELHVTNELEFGVAYDWNRLLAKVDQRFSSPSEQEKIVAAAKLIRHVPGQLVSEYLQRWLSATKGLQIDRKTAELARVMHEQLRSNTSAWQQCNAKKSEVEANGDPYTWQMVVDTIRGAGDLEASGMGWGRQHQPQREVFVAHRRETQRLYNAPRNTAAQRQPTAVHMNAGVVQPPREQWSPTPGRDSRGGLDSGRGGFNNGARGGSNGGARGGFSGPARGGGRGGFGDGRGGSNATGRGPYNGSFGSGAGPPSNKPAYQPSTRGNFSERGRGGAPAGMGARPGIPRTQCYNCGATTHIQRDCPRPPKTY
jgi:hypothetical protein